MKRLFFLPLVFALAFMFAACDSGNTGDFKITLKLPIDTLEVCGDFEPDDNSGQDYTYCINETDQVQLSIYSKADAKDDYAYTDRTLIPVTDNKGESGKEFIRSLKKGAYYRFFVEVTNSNEKLKLTGGVEGIYYDDTKNYKVDIFLAPAGDFARVVSDRLDEGADFGSLASYFDEMGSQGAAAVALKDGRIYMAGGVDLTESETTNKAAILDMKSLSNEVAEELPAPLYDHIAALLDDYSESGKVIVGLGTKDDESLNEMVWVYDPESDEYATINIGAPAMTKAKAITIDGDVYIVGGCTDSGASNAVYKISAKSGKIVPEKFATLQQGRCNHAIADVSTVVENKGTKTVTPRILVIGGTTNGTEGKKGTPVLGENFAELVTKGSSKSMPIEDRKGGDDAELKKTGLVAPAAVGLIMDDKEDDETVVSVLGGYIFNNSGDAVTLVNNPNLFVFSENGDKLIYDKNSTPNECARPSAARLGSEEKSVFKYVAVNCGIKSFDRSEPDDQIIFVLQVKRVKDSDLDMEVFSSSVKDTLMEGNKDNVESGFIIDGPVASDGLGQVFMLGGKYVYQVGSYAIP